MVKSYLAQNSDLLDWRGQDNNPTIAPWKPEPLSNEQWPPNYKAVYAWRLRQLAKLRNDPALLHSAKIYYRTRPKEFILHWMDTYDPRRSGNKWIPFVLFARQAQFIDFLDDCTRDNESGLVEKCRDGGITWLACAYTDHAWLFNKNDAIGWGSRKQELVDNLGDVNSIFEKLRMIIRRLPDIWKPVGLDERRHMTRMKMINPENGSVITGEIGEGIGRGARTRIYFKDESAHYEHPEKIEAALGDTTNIQIDISSVNGLGNVFHRRRQAGINWSPGVAIMPGYVRVFIFDWHDHPLKTQAWYDQRKAKYIREGLQHLFAQEVDRNYSAAISNTIIPLEWIMSSIDAHKAIRWRDDQGAIHVGIPDRLVSGWGAGLDVADGGIDRNALAIRQGIIWRSVEEWGERDPGVTTRRAIMRCRNYRLLTDLSGERSSMPYGIKIQYDSIGIGSSVKSEYNRLIDEKLLAAAELQLVGWNAGAAVLDPFFRVIPDDDQSPLNKDYFHNFKAQAWWSLRTRFYKTWNNITNGVIYSIDEMISLDRSMLLLDQLTQELAQPTTDPSSSLKMVVNKKPDGMKSPNLADAGVMMYFPVRDLAGPLIGRYGF